MRELKDEVDDEASARDMLELKKCRGLEDSSRQIQKNDMGWRKREASLAVRVEEG